MKGALVFFHLPFVYDFWHGTKNMGVLVLQHDSKLLYIYMMYMLYIQPF